MRKLFLIAGCLLALTTMGQEVRAENIIRRANSSQSHAITQRANGIYSQPGTNVSRFRTGSGGASANRLPAGRSYYQGRYFGNLNNRFYGPQYGYF